MAESCRGDSDRNSPADESASSNKHGNGEPEMSDLQVNKNHDKNGSKASKKKVYHSIFGPGGISDSDSGDDVSSYRTDSEMNETDEVKTPAKNKTVDFIRTDVNSAPSDNEIECMQVGSNVGSSVVTEVSPVGGQRDFETQKVASEPFLSPEEKEAVSHLALTHIAQELDKRNAAKDLDKISSAKDLTKLIAAGLLDNCNTENNEDKSDANDDESEVRLYTGPYGRIQSPFKKFSSFHGFPGGVKRSPRKWTGPAAKRTKLFHDNEDIGESSSSDNSPRREITPPRHTPVEEMKESNTGSWEETSDDEEKLAIIEDDPNSEFDKKLEDKSSKFSLSVVNVKSIIHKIVTNENVIEMVRKAVQQEIDGQELKYEPKMTRSKLKEFEAQGQVPTNWGLSPRKKRESPNFLEMELPEDEEDDEDFNPEKVVQESDEDSESVLSSCLSDIGSPLPSTPRSMPSTPTLPTPQTVSTPTTADTEMTSLDDSSSHSFLSPMGPPLQTCVPKSQHKTSSELGRKFQEAMERDKQQSEEEAELIASRTRSKFPLTDCSIIDLEANFVAPDITQDMYEICDDYDWKEFLSTLIRFPGDDDTLTNALNTTNEDDTEDDPEYNYLAEYEMLEDDKEDYRDDRAVKVSKKEMNGLIDDILNNDNNDDNLDDRYKITIKTQSEKIVFNSNTKKRKEYQQSLISAIGLQERKQIDDQLRKHVQQLSQTYMMAQTGLEEHEPVADVAKFYLDELSSFADRSEALYGRTTFRVCSLDHALRLLDNRSWEETEVMSLQNKERLAAVTFKFDSQLLPAFCYRQMKTIWTSPIYMFPDLLPHGRFFRHVDIKKDRARVKFLESEDNLLAMGIAQFSHLKKDAKDYIQRFMLPPKSRKQIEIRIKNLNAKAAKDNAVKFYKKYRKLPRFPQHAPDFNISMMKSLKDSQYDWNELPHWCRFFSEEEKSLLNESVRKQIDQQRKIKRRRKARQSVSFSLSDSDMLPMYTPPHPSTSAPVTPHHETDSSVSGSSGSESSITFLPVKRKRPRRQSRKRLNMGQEKKSRKGTQSSFVPLTVPGTSFPQPSQQAPLTICVLDNLQGATPVSNTVGSHVGTVPGIPMATCGTPTIVVINKNTPLQVQSFSHSVTFTSANTIPQNVTQYTQSPNIHVVSQTATSYTQSSIKAQAVPTVDSTKSDCEIDGKSLTFEDICRPIMEAEMAAGVSKPSVNNKELCTLYTESGTVVNLNNVRNDMIVNIVENVSGKPKSLPTGNTNLNPGSNSQNTAIEEAGSPNQTGNVQNLNKPNGEVQSSEISSSTVVNCQTEANLDSESNVQDVTFQDMASSPIPVGDQKQEVTLRKEAVTSTGEHERESTGTDSLLAQCSCTPPSKANPLTGISSDMAMSDEKTPKSSLEVVAALAPYFISPIHSSGSLQQAMETTPTKRPLPALAPKSLSPSQRTAPISFSDLSPAKRRRIKSSPTKKHLQQQVKTILPKGFVVSSFDTSPAKKAASSLVDKAKQRVSQSKGFCKILPRPSKQTMKQESQLIKGTKRGLARKNVASTKARNETDKSNELAKERESEASPNDFITENVDEDTDDVNDNAVVDEEDRCGDTESDYTQSEDGNETQGTDGEDIDTQGTDDGEATLGTDGDSQESQEEDNHIADLMAASTTMGFIPGRDDLYSRSRLKKDRDRDLTMALLDPDIVEADPQRDLRDTLFAQAYIHKVKKTFRDDMDKLEQFLKIMYHFSQDSGTPIKLYKELQELFSGHPDLINDFAGFLQAEQAIECGCYKAYKEFVQARTFLRKLEIYFNKNPNQLQKVMRTFSRWYKKPGRKETDLREQIEPMLKGQKLLLEEFSRFFPNERPSESLMDDFEEINLDDSGEIEDKDTSFEEIELLDMEDVYGTKRCVCGCHDDGDDTYRKRKKHCYQCCLTVIDGEPVYKVNKSTIKKISVTYGPPVKLSSLQNINQSDDGKGEPVQAETASLEPINAASSTTVAGEGEPVQTGSSTNEMEERESGNLDWFLDSETAEKENIEHYNEGANSEEAVQQKKKSKTRSPQNKESFLQRISKLPRNQPQDKAARLSSVIKGKSPSPSSQDGQSSNIDKEKQKGEMEVEYSENELKANSEVDNKNVKEEKSENDVQTKYNAESMAVDTAKVKKSLSSVELDTSAKPRQVNEEPSALKSKISSVEKERTQIKTNEENKTNLMKLKEPIASHQESEKVNGLINKEEQSDERNDILASAFSSALNTEVSMDTSSCFPFSLTDNAHKPLGENKCDQDLEKVSQVSNKETFSSVEPKVKPTVMQSVTSNNGTVVAPVGQHSLNISPGSFFQKVPFAENITPVSSKAEAEKETKVQVELSKVEEGTEASSSKHVDKIDTAPDASKSPPFSPFSPFSPFAQEIQSITSAQSPISAVHSPGIARSLSSSGKVRRITPIPVKGSDGKTDSQSSFQTAMENSPVLPDLPVSSPSDNSQSANSKLTDIVTAMSSDSGENSKGVPEKADIASVTINFGSGSQILADSSQKSGSSTTDNSSSQTSVTSEPSFTRKTISQPDIFSENANVGFPKVGPGVSNSNLGHSGLLSEESLFHCLSKPPDFTETIPNVSNLTNILNALDGHSQGIDSQRQSHEHDTSQKNTSSFPLIDNQEAVNSVKDSNQERKNKVDGHDNTSNEIDCKDKIEAETAEGKSDKGANFFTSESVNESLILQCSGDSEGGTDSFYPQSVESLENLKRLKTGLFKVGRLSDSDTSGVSTPSSSATNVLDKNTNVAENVKQISVPKTDSDIESSRKDTEGNTTATRNDKHVIGKNGETESDSTTKTESQGKRKKRKMSRRELIRSLQGKDTSEQGGEAGNLKISGNEEENDSDEVNDFGTSQRMGVPETVTDVQGEIKTENSSSCAGNVIESDKSVEICYVKPQSDVLVTDWSGTGVTPIDERLGEIKTEDSEFLDTTGLSDIQSISDSVSETSSRGHKKSKHKHKSDKERHRKKKKRKDDKHSESTPNTERKKKKKSRRKEHKEQTLEKSEVNISAQESAIEEENKEVVEHTDSNIQDLATTVTENEEGSAASVEDPTIDEPEWTKETDKMILESCKVHGIKEKTFARIAKRIGNVTSTQVRRRFEHLYGMIFGRPFGEKSDQ